MIDFRARRQGLAVRDPRRSDCCFDIVVLLQCLDDDHQVQLAHAGDQHRAGLRIDADPERRIFARHRGERLPEPLMVGRGTRLDHGLDHRIGAVQAGKHQGMSGIAQRLARSCGLQTEHGNDITGRRRVDLRFPIRMHAQQTPDPLRRAGRRIHQHVAARDAAGIEPHERQRAVAAHLHLRDERDGRRIGRGRARFHRTRARVRALDRRPIVRRRSIRDDRIEQRLHTDIAICRAAQHRLSGTDDDSETNQPLQLRSVEPVAAFEIPPESVIIELDHLLDERDPRRLRLRHQRCRNRFDPRRHRPGRPNQRMHRHEIDHAAERLLGTERSLHDERTRTKPVRQHADDPIEVRAHLIHLVDETDARDAETLRLPPHRFRLRLHA